MTVQDTVLTLARAAVPGRQVLDSDEAQSTVVEASGYSVVYCSGGDVGRTDVAGTPDELRVSVTLHSFGPTREAAQWMSSKIVDYLLGQWVTVTGYRAASFTDHQRRPPAVDNDVPERPLVIVVDQLSLTTVKA